VTQQTEPQHQSAAQDYDPNRPVNSWAVLAIAVPITLSNATTPLVGFVDTAVIGQLGQAHMIGAVAVAANVFSLVYWAFGFLRMGTTGLTAQAVGARDAGEIAANLYRPLIIGAAAGLVLIVVQVPIALAAFSFVGASAAVEAEAYTYFTIRIWAAPAALMNYALLGWFIGRGRAGLAFAIQLILNGINLALSVLLVLGFGLAVAGVAWAVVIAEVAALVIGLVLARRALAAVGTNVSIKKVLDLDRLRRLLAVNADIMIRTLCLLIMFFFFTAQGARAGDETLAANALLQAMTTVTVYFLDGFAYSVETLVGQAVGARARARFDEAVRLSTLWAVVVSLVLSVALCVAGPMLIASLTTSQPVRDVAASYLVWAALTPILGVWCFQLDGIFIGATRTRDMRNMMILSLAAFLAAWVLLAPAYGNHGLWAALRFAYLVRAVTLAARYPALTRATFAK